MAAELINPPPSVPPALALRMSQQAPRILQQSSGPSLPYPLSLLTASEAPETWIGYENLMLACLRTGDDRSARICLEKLTQRFGEDNERVMALRGMYHEAVAEDYKALESIFRGYEEVLKKDPTNMPIRKRRVALLKAMNRPIDATTALVGLLDASPTDAEAWAELADLYLTQNLYAQAIFSLEEVLLITPNAWNIHARMGEILYLSSLATNSNNDGNLMRGLCESMRRFCRSIELCDNYLRGYYGLKLVRPLAHFHSPQQPLSTNTSTNNPLKQTTKHLLSLLSKTSKPAPAAADPQFGDLAPPSLATIERLHELATAKLAEIVRRNAAGESGWDGYDQAEVIAAGELLGRDAQKIER
ncbi:Inositol phosphatase SIW14 [Coniosporium tulheliwenetii]|uniref:Inositol phosphatase SIW14 n=1 Tax=Coniosporium tulheliwenetii TaxID=3383036 RepID=A0ACC2ZCB2_9PEZI|nr:Inositol phosphatase SIW14 [Cladosporium sp. JES 115]